VQLANDLVAGSTRIEKYDGSITETDTYGIFIRCKFECKYDSRALDI